MDEEIGALLSRANLTRVRGNLSEAQAICQSALELCPTSADAHSLLGDLFAAQEKHDEALHCYSVAAELKPQNAALAEKRDKAIQARHLRLLTNQQQAQRLAVPEVAHPAVPRKNAPRRPLPRWLMVTLIAIGGLVVLFLGVWLGTRLAPGSDLVPTKLPATVGRKD
ncbi:tetratricopeptide repeat protein [Armatimonas sp.]|uniref:tetratricopeptide repeat protein n=1 Tax=Armatimonas sp. TaxID=1872638 RepID=UPI003752459B